MSAEESLNVFGGTLGALRSWMLLFVELCIVTFATRDALIGGGLSHGGRKRTDAYSLLGQVVNNGCFRGALFRFLVGISKKLQPEIVSGYLIY